MPRQSIGTVSLSAKRLRCHRSHFKIRALRSFSRLHQRPQVSSITEKNCDARLRQPMPPISLLRTVTYQLQERRLKSVEQRRLRSCKKALVAGSKKGLLITKRPCLSSRRSQIELTEKQPAPSTSLIEQQKPHDILCQSDTSIIYSSIESDAGSTDGLSAYPRSDFILRAASLPSTTLVSAQFPVESEERSGTNGTNHSGASRWNNDLCVSNGPLAGHLAELVTDAPSSMPLKNCLGARRRGSSQHCEQTAKNMAYSTSKKRRLSKVIQPSESFNSVNASRWSGYRGAQPMGSGSFALGAIPCTSEIHGQGSNPFGHTMRGATVGLLGRNAPYLASGVGFLDNCRFCHRQILRKGQSRPRICLQCEKKKATPIHDRCKDCKEPIVRSNVRKARICQKCKKHREKARSVYPVGLSAAAVMPLSYSQGGTHSYGSSNAGYLGTPAVTPLATLVTPSFPISHSSGGSQRFPTSLVNSRRVHAVNNYLYWLQVLSQTTPVVSPLCYTSSTSFQTPQFSDHASLLSHAQHNAPHNKCLQFLPPTTEENRSTSPLQMSVMKNHSGDRSLGEHHTPFHISYNVASPSNETETSAVLSSKENVHGTKKPTVESNAMLIRKDQPELGPPNNDPHGAPRNVSLHTLDQYSSRIVCNSSAHSRETISATQDYQGGVQDFSNGHQDFVPCMASVVPCYGNSFSNREEILSHQNPQHLHILSAQDTLLGRSTGSPLAPQLYSYLRKIATEEFSTPEEIVEHLRSRWKKSRNITSVTLYNVPCGSESLETQQESNGNPVGSTTGLRDTGPILIPQVNPYTLLHHLAVHEHRQHQQEHIHWKSVNQHQPHHIGVFQSLGFPGTLVAEVPQRTLEAMSHKSQYTQENNEVELTYSNAHGLHPELLTSASSGVLLDDPMLSAMPANAVTVETKTFSSKNQVVQTSGVFGNVLNNGSHEAVFASESNSETASLGHVVPPNTLYSTSSAEDSSAPCSPSEFPVKDNVQNQELKTSACDTADKLSNHRLSSGPLEITRQRKRARCLSDASNSQNCPWVFAQGETQQCLRDAEKTTPGLYMNVQMARGKPDRCSLSLPEQKDSCDITGVKTSPLEYLSSSHCLSPILNENKSFIHINLSLDAPSDEEFMDVCVASQSLGDKQSPSASHTHPGLCLASGDDKKKNSCNDSCSDVLSDMNNNRTSFKIKPKDVMSSQVSSKDPNWVANAQPLAVDALSRISGDLKSESTMAPLHLFAALFLSSLVEESTTSQISNRANVKQEESVNDLSCNISHSASSRKSSTPGAPVVQLKQEKVEKREEEQISVSAVSDPIFLSNLSSFSSLSVGCGPTDNPVVVDTIITSPERSADFSLCSKDGALKGAELPNISSFASNSATEPSRPCKEMSQLQGPSRVAEPHAFSLNASFPGVSAPTPAICCLSSATLAAQPVVFSGNTCGARKKRVLKGVSPRRLVVASSV